MSSSIEHRASSIEQRTTKTMPYFLFDSRQVYFDTTGEGFPLLLLHGNSVSSKMFTSEIKYYSQFFNVIYFDYPGHGRSDRMDIFRDDFWHYNALAALELLKHLKIDCVNAIGTSGGALVGLNMACMNPGVINRLIADSFIGLRVSAEEAKRIRNDRKKAKEEILASAFWKYMHGSDWSRIVDEDLDMLVRVGENNIPTIQCSLSKIKCPVLATASTEDELIHNIQPRIEEVVRRIPNARAMFFNEGKHPFMITKKKEFRKLAMDFLGQ